MLAASDATGTDGLGLLVGENIVWGARMIGITKDRRDLEWGISLEKRLQIPAVKWVEWK